MRHVCTLAPLICIEHLTGESVARYALFPESFQIAMAAKVSTFCIIIMVLTSVAYVDYVLRSYVHSTDGCRIHVFI